MPKDEFDFDDPLELNGVALATDEDTTRDMAECFVEEFLRLGFDHRQLFGMFHNPYYVGVHLVLRAKGEAFVRDVITEVFARWGRQIEWPTAGTGRREEDPTPQALPLKSQSALAATAQELEQKPTDPLGNPLPELNL